MPAYQIEIQQRFSRYKISEAQLKRAASGILKALGWKKAAVSIVLVSDKQIRPINKKHLGHDWATDVISFSQIEGKALKASPKTAPFLGDLVISLETTARQAEEYGNDFFYELCFYVCHGILHLMGHSDATVKLAKRMENKQKTILKKIGIKNSVTRSPVTCHQ
jgi:probable rRNA maturation factor